MKEIRILMAGAIAIALLASSGIGTAAAQPDEIPAELPEEEVPEETPLPDLPELPDVPEDNPDDVLDDVELPEEVDLPTESPLE